MAKNRKKAEEVVLQWMDKIDLSGTNSKLLKEMFAKMSDPQFDHWINECRAKREYVPIVIPNLDETVGITVENNLKVGEEMGIEWFQRLWIVDPTTGRKILSKERYLCMWVKVRRQIQTLVDGFTVAEHNNSVNDLTDQPTGDSKGGGISFPELLILKASELDHVSEEIVRIRGGDEPARRLIEKNILETGYGRVKSVENLETRAKVSDTLHILFNGMHYANTF